MRLRVAWRQRWCLFLFFCLTSQSLLWWLIECVEQVNEAKARQCPLTDSPLLAPGWAGAEMYSWISQSDFCHLRSLHLEKEEIGTNPETCFSPSWVILWNPHSGTLSCLAWLDGFSVPTGDPLPGSRTLVRQVPEGFLGGLDWWMPFPLWCAVFRPTPSSCVADPLSHVCKREITWYHCQVQGLWL